MLARLPPTVCVLELWRLGGELLYQFTPTFGAGENAKILEAPAIA